MRQGNRWLIGKRDLQCNIKISVRLLVLLFFEPHRLTLDGWDISDSRKEG